MSDGNGDRMIRDQILVLRTILICNIVACMSAGNHEHHSTDQASGERLGPERTPISSRVRPCREIASAALFGGEREIHIRHADKVYTLRQTSKGKLILTK